METPSLSDTSPLTSEALEGESLRLNPGQLKFIEKHGLKAFIEKVEDQIVSHFFYKNKQRVRKTLKMLKISNSAFYRISQRIKDKAKDKLTQLRR